MISSYNFNRESTLCLRCFQAAVARCMARMLALCLQSQDPAPPAYYEQVIVQLQKRDLAKKIITKAQKLKVALNAARRGNRGLADAPDGLETLLHCTELVK